MNLSRTSVSGNTVTMTFTTTTWSDPASVMITANGSDVQQSTGSTRNKLNFKLTGSGSTPNNKTNVTMSVANVRDTWENWQYGKTVTVNGLESNADITFTYSTRSDKNKKNYVGTTTAGALANGTVKIDFKEQ